MDTSTSNSDTPGSGAVDTFDTPDKGKTLTGDWTAEHTYAAPGTYTVEAKLMFNRNHPHTTPVLVPAESNPSNDIIQALASMSVSVPENALACDSVVDNGGNESTATTTVTIIKDWVFLSETTSTLPAFEIAFDGEVVLSNVTATSSVTLSNIKEGPHTFTETIVTGFTPSLACEQDNGDGGTNSLSMESNGNFSFSGNGEVTCTVINTEVDDTEVDDTEGSGGEGTVSGSSTNGGGGSTQTFGGGIPTSNSVGGGPNGFIVPQVLGIQDTAETILTCGEQYPTAALITGELDDLLATYGFARDLPREAGLGQTILSKIVPAGITLTQQQIITNFIVYGIEALLHLGEGERAGLVASFERIYGSYPENECDWQNVIRIGEGVVPVVLVPERETDAETAFTTIYKRAADRAVEQDNVTVLIMAYGLRPDVRSMAAEIQAGAIFRSVFGHFPGNTGEWDVMRGIAYGGLTVPGFAAITR